MSLSLLLLMMLMRSASRIVISVTFVAARGRWCGHLHSIGLPPLQPIGASVGSGGVHLQRGVRCIVAKGAYASRAQGALLLLFFFTLKPSRAAPTRRETAFAVGGRHLHTCFLLKYDL